MRSSGDVLDQKRIPRKVRRSGAGANLGGKKGRFGCGRFNRSRDRDPWNLCRTQRPFVHLLKTQMVIFFSIETEIPAERSKNLAGKSTG
jgi:hypothetical protein